MDKNYLDKVVRPYGEEITSIRIGSGDTYKVGMFYADFDVNNPNDAVFQVYTVEDGGDNFDVEDVGVNEVDYNDYTMLMLFEQAILTVNDLLTQDVTLYKEVKF